MWGYGSDQGKDHGTQKCFEPCRQKAQIVANGGHHDAVGTPIGAGIGVALEVAIGFQVAKDRFDGVAPSQFPFDGGSLLEISHFSSIS